MLVADNDDHHDDYDDNENDESVHLFHCALVPICAPIACTHLDDHMYTYIVHEEIWVVIIITHICSFGWLGC